MRRPKFDRAFSPWPEESSSRLCLDDGSRVAVVGGGPAGSFFGYFLLDMAERMGMDLQVEIYEPRDFSRPGPLSCNMCGGIVSESLVQTLAAEGINLPPTVVQRGIDSYLLHMDVGSVRIEIPLQEKRIGAVYRGSGPKGIQEIKWGSFDDHLQRLAVRSSMQIFLLNISGLEFAAIIPKGDYVTVCLLGNEIHGKLFQSFLNSPEVRQCMPPGWCPDQFACHCSPRMSIQGAVQPFADRIVFVGDSGVTRLYKDGIGAAYRNAKAAASTAVFQGISVRDFRQHYWPVCKAIDTDNGFGRVVFAVTRHIQRWRFAHDGP